MDPATPATPSNDDLKRIAAFIWGRSLDEARGAGVMEYFTNNGVTVEARFPNTFQGDKSKASAWLDGHTPDRFMSMAHELANLADGLINTHRAVSDALAGHQARILWRSLVRAARLWDGHPDFDPAWAEQDEG